MPPDKRRPLGNCKLLLVNLKTLSVTPSVGRSVELFTELQEMMDETECGRGQPWPNLSYYSDIFTKIMNISSKRVGFPKKFQLNTFNIRFTGVVV